MPGTLVGIAWKGPPWAGPGLEVEGVFVAGAAAHPQQDAALGGALAGLGGAGGQDVEPAGDRCAEHAGGGQPEQVAAGWGHDRLLGVAAVTPI